MCSSIRASGISTIADIRHIVVLLLLVEFRTNYSSRLGHVLVKWLALLQDIYKLFGPTINVVH
jgi:hypothetical protein